MDKLRLLVGRFASPSVGSRLTKQELCLGFSALHKLLSTPQISSNNLRESNSSTIKEVRNALQSSVLANRVKRLSPGCSTKEIAMLAEGWSVIHWSRWDVVDHLVLSFFQLHQKRLANRNAFSNGNAKGIALQSSVLIELTVLLEAAVASSHYVNATLARVVEETLAEVLRYASSTTALSIEPKEVVFRFMCSACSYLGVKRLKEIVNIQLLSTSFPSSASSSSRNFDDKDNLSSFPSGQQEHSNLALQSTIKEFMAGLNEMHSGPFQQLQRKTLDRQGLLQRLSEGEDPALQRTSKEGARFALYSWWAAGRDQIPAQLLKEFVTLFVYHGFQDIVLQEGLEETILGVLDHSKNVPEDSNASSEEYTGVLLRGLSEAVYKRPEVFPKVRGALAAMNKGFSNSPESLQTQRAVCKAFEKAVDGIFAGEEVLSRILEELDLYTADERAMALTVLSMGRKLPEGIAQTLLSEVSGLSADGLSAIFFSLQFDTSGLLLSISEAAMQHVLNASSLQGLSFKALALLIRGLSQPVSRFISPSVSFLTLRKKFIESVVQLVVDRVHFSSLSLTEMLEIGIHMCGIDEENAVLDLICRKVSSAIKQREIVEPRFYVEILDMLMQTQYIDEELLDIISEPLTVLVVQKGVEHCLRHELSAQNADEGDCSAHRDACLLLLQFALFQSVLDAPALYPAAQLITSAVSMRMDISSSLLIAAGLLEEREGNELSVHRIISRLEESRAQDSENNFSLEISVVPFALHFLYQAKGMKPPLALLKAVSQTLEVYITATPLSSSLLISPADVARFIVVLGQSQRSEEQLAPSPTLSDFCSRAVLSFSPTLYTAIAGVLGAFKNCEPLTTEMVESLPQMLNRLSPKQISEVIFGFGQIPDAGLLLAHQLSADVASDYVVDNSELFYSGKWISRMLHGFSLLHITKRALYAVFSERLSKRSVLATMDRVSISLAMSAFGTAKFLHKGLFDKFSRIFVDHVKGLSSADLLLSIKAMSRVMLLDPQFYSTMGDEVCKKTDELSVGAQCDLLHAFGAVDLPHHQLAETVSSNIATRLAELPDANAACAVLVSLARMGYDIRGDQNVHLIADHIANHVDELSCHSTAAICAVLEEANWKHTPMLKAIAEHSVSLKKNEELTPECSRGVLDLLAKNLLHHPTARNELTPLARVVSRDVVLLSEDEALEHQLLIAR